MTIRLAFPQAFALNDQTHMRPHRHLLSTHCTFMILFACNFYPSCFDDFSSSTTQLFISAGTFFTIYTQQSNATTSPNRSDCADVQNWVKNQYRQPCHPSVLTPTPSFKIFPSSTSLSITTQLFISADMFSLYTRIKRTHSSQQKQMCRSPKLCDKQCRLL